MAGPTELPEQVSQFVDLSKEYLLQETVEPAKRLGRYAGFSLAAAAAFALGAFFLAIAAMRWIADRLPEGPNWEAAGYLISVAVLALIALAMVAFTGRDSGSD